MNLLFLVFLAVVSPQQQKLSDTIVVTASDTPEPVASTPAAVSVVTKTDIERQAARDVADVLRDVPGVTISRSGSPGKATSLFMRGAGSTQTLVLWNGIELNNPYFSGYDWGRFSTAGVEQIEVVRGPFSALYGSDAVAGVVNVISAPRSNSFRAEIEGGGHGLRNGLVDGGWVSGANQLSGAIEDRRDDGFAANDDFHQRSENLFWRFAPMQSFSIGLAARHTTYDLGIPFNLNGNADALVPSLNRRQSGNERQLAIPIAQTIGRFSYDLVASESRQRDDFSDPDDPFGFVASSTTARTRRARLTTRTPLFGGTFIAGAETESARVDDVNNFGTNLDHLGRRDHSFFAEERASHPLGGATRVEISAGVRYDKFDTFGSQTSPRVAAALVTGASKWRIAYGQGFRAPSIGELYFPFSGNRALQAEHSDSIEAGYDAPMGANGLFSATIFRSRYRNLITFDNSTYAFANIGAAKSDGLELGMQENLSASSYLGVSYTYLHKDEDEATGERLPRRPKHSGSLLLGWRLAGLDANVAVVRSGARNDILPVSPFSTVVDPAYTTIDVNLQMHAGAITPFVKMENLRNTRYEEVRGFMSPGRRAIFGLRATM